MISGVENTQLYFYLLILKLLMNKCQKTSMLCLILQMWLILYQDKDIEEIVTACKAECVKKNLQPNKMNIFSQYLLRVKSNMHVVIAMSPINDKI